MNILVVLVSCMLLVSICAIVIDHHYYHAATISCLEKKLGDQYEKEAYLEREKALNESQH